MTGASKKRANQERDKARNTQGGPSSSSGSSPGGNASQSARSTTESSASASARGGYDGNRDPDAPGPAATRNPNTTRPVTSDNMAKSIDLGAIGYARLNGNDLPTGLAPREPPSTLGIATQVQLNSYDIVKYPTMKIYQFEVLVGSGAEKRGLIQKVWESKAVKDALGAGWIFDGNRLAWAAKPIEREQRLTVDLDQESGKTPREGKENKHRIVVRQTNAVGFASLQGYLNGQSDFNNDCLESLNFLDHLFRETPSRKYTQIKRSFFARGQQRFSLTGGVEAFKGVYQSPRIGHSPNGAILTLNVDVMNGTFWTESQLHHAAVALTGKSDINALVVALKQGNSPTQMVLKKLRKLHVIANHRAAKTGTPDEYVIDRFVNTSARDFKFEKDGKPISIYDYFQREFNIRLQYPDLPLVKMTKGKNTLLPMEVLKIKQNQRYNFKMDERQTSNMIKFAVTAPPARWADIQHGIGMLDHANDPVLRAYGVQVSAAPKTVAARLLPAPTVKFGVGEAKPGTSGRWDLKGKKFLSGNAAPLKTWAVCVVPGRRGGKPDRAIVEKFLADFIKIYIGHGGRVENKAPAFILASGAEPSGWVTAAWNAAGNQSQSRPQMLVFVLPDKDSDNYGKIKRSADCRYGVVSQCMQYAHVQKGQGQYISNVCMKFNAKLGGSTCRATGPKTGGPGGAFQVPTMVLGADVSHAAPGAQTPSMAALTASMDLLGIRYAAACETNGFRVEMISPDNIKSMMKPLLQAWIKGPGKGQWPRQIIYFRDGVSEAQYAHVLAQEVADMKALIKTADPKLDIPFIVVVGGKRHHVRFFPTQGKGDRNGNPLPGTLVETGVTHPRENDFYLNSHAAIKGTARPMHYQVLLNEPKMPNSTLQTLIYEQCYQYIRATTPISQHPAIYYAHLASNRAVPHDAKWGSSSSGGMTSQPTQPTQPTRPRTGSQSGSQGGRSPSRTGGSSSGAPQEFDKLMPMPNQGDIQTSMWYI